MCKKCRNPKCSLAGKYNAFMGGKHTCVSYDDGEEKPRDYQAEWLDSMAKKIRITW